MAARAQLLVSSLPASSNDPDVPPYIYTQHVSMGAPVFRVAPSAALLVAMQSVVYTHFRSSPNQLGGGTPRYEWHFDAFESAHRLDGEPDVTIVSAAQLQPLSWTRLFAGPNTALLIPDSDSVRRQHAGVYRLVRCSYNDNTGDSAVQIVMALVLHVKNTFDTLVLAPNTPRVTISAPIPEHGSATTTNWIVLALDKRIQQMRRPALLQFNDDLARVAVLLNEAAKNRDLFSWRVDPITGVNQVVSDTLQHYVSQDIDAPLWTDDSRLHSLLLILSMPVDLPIATTTSLRVLCKYPFEREVPLYYYHTPANRFVDSPRYKSWIQIFDRVMAAHADNTIQYAVLMFVDLLLKYTSRTYEKQEPLYGLVDGAEFMYMTATNNPRAYDHALDLQLPVDDERVFEEYSSPHGVVAAPINFLCVAMQSTSSVPFTLANARVVAVTHVHVLPDCVVAGVRAPTLLFNGAEPPIYDNAARQALSTHDPNWFTSESDAVIKYWYAMPANNSIGASQRDILSTVARRLTAGARLHANMFSLARSLSDDPEVNEQVDSNGVVFICVEELCDRLTLAQSLLLRDLSIGSRFDTVSPTQVDSTSAVPYETNVVITNAANTLKNAAAFSRFALRRVRHVLYSAKEIEPPAVVAVAPAGLSFESSLFNSAHWFDQLFHVRRIVEQALSNQRAKDVLVVVSSKTMRPIVLEDELSALDVIGARKRYLNAAKTVLVDQYADVKTIIYTGRINVPLVGTSVTKLLSSLPDAVDENVLRDYTSVRDIPVLTLCSRYNAQPSDDSLQHRLASSLIEELSNRFTALWDWIVVNTAYDGVNFHRDPKQVRLVDVDTRLLLTRYGGRMESEQRQLIGNWHVPYVSYHVLADLLRFERIGQAVAAVILGTVLLLALATMADPKSIAVLPPALVQQNPNVVVPPPQPSLTFKDKVDQQAAQDLADLLSAFGLFI